MTGMKPGVSVLICDATGTVRGEQLRTWKAVLQTLNRPWQLLVVSAEMPDGEGVTWVSMPTGTGTGSRLRAGLEVCTQPSVLFISSDYPYTPADLPKFLERLETASEMPDAQSGEWVLRTPDAVVGCRTGVAVPLVPKVLGRFVRHFARWVLGLPLQPLPGWYGFGEHLRAWQAWIVYGVPLQDPQCAFKLFRRSFLDRFPIQSDGDFVHIEVMAKATFLTVMIDELPLTPAAVAIPNVAWLKQDRKLISAKPKFWQPSPEML